MSLSSREISNGPRFHPDAFDFLRVALRYTVHHTHRMAGSEGVGDEDEGQESQHVTGPELLEGIRRYALEQFGLLTLVVFDRWGVHSTDDFGRMVFELIDRGEMFKTDQDELNDFFDVYDFERAFDHEYEIDTSRAFSA